MEHLHAIIEDAAGAVRSGEVIGVPTDTLYGLAADPFDQNALERIFAIKGRPGVKPLAVLVADLDQAQQIAAFSDRALDLAEEHWPGALTLVLPKLASVPQWVGQSERRTVGLRCPGHEVALELLRVTGPLAVTSANISGQEGVLDDIEARALFGDEVAVYVPGEAPGGTSSTILDLTEPAEWVLREGPVQP
jgi:tRNA threonylcarbamoyl adenosine modification protein (Sua5/YciO/YrdC/YwlC family)